MISSLKSIVVSSHQAQSRDEKIYRAIVPLAACAIFYLFGFRGFNPNVAAALINAITVLTGLLINVLVIFMSWATAKRATLDPKNLSFDEKNLIANVKHVLANISFATVEGVICIVFIAIALNLDPASSSLVMQRVFKGFSFLSVALLVDLTLMMVFSIDVIYALLMRELPDVTPKKR
jgi:hypothetical protein